MRPRWFSAGGGGLTCCEVLGSHDYSIARLPRFRQAKLARWVKAAPTRRRGDDAPGQGEGSDSCHSANHIGEAEEVGGTRGEDAGQMDADGVGVPAVVVP